jgi:hypothetical protein
LLVDTAYIKKQFSRVGVDWSDDFSAMEFKGNGAQLAQLGRAIVWIPSGATSFMKGARQMRQLADKGATYSDSVFGIRDQHPRTTLS